MEIVEKNPPTWMQLGLCRKVDPEVWFEPSYEETAAAVCSICPAKVECLEFALELERASFNTLTWGVWGGQTAKKRAAVLKAETRGRS